MGYGRVQVLPRTEDTETPADSRSPRAFRMSRDGVP